jgi:hypothetical protein
VDKRTVLRNLEFDYLADYLGYAGQSREYINDCLSAAFRADPNPVRRTFHVLAQVQLEYAAYEDAAAMLHALLTFKRSPDGSIIEALEGYRPGEAVIGKVLAAHEANSPEQLFRALRFADACPVQWSGWFPNHDLTKALHVGCQFFANDCAPSHKELGIAASPTTTRKLKTAHGSFISYSALCVSLLRQPSPWITARLFRRGGGRREPCGNPPSYGTCSTSFRKSRRRGYLTRAGLRPCPGLRGDIRRFLGRWSCF